MLDPIIQKKISELPENIRHAVESFDWASEILHIAQDNKIQIDDIETFRNETLLVIVGLTAAADFEKNLVAHMGISYQLAEKLVADANAHIFTPLQKIAFSPKPDLPEEEIIEHHEISSVLQDHGIQLVDEFETESRPKNELQDLADSLFQKNDEITHVDKNKTEPESTQEHKTIDEKKNTPKDQKINYNEPIEASDLRGVKKQTIDTSIIKQKNKQTTPKLEQQKMEHIHISQNESFDLSPTEQELVLENGDFLKHIGAIEE